MHTGQAGNVRISVGPSGLGDGGSVGLFAGHSSATRSAGGSVLITAGDGTSNSPGDGGDGGDVR